MIWSVFWIIFPLDSPFNMYRERDIYIYICDYKCTYIYIHMLTPPRSLFHSLLGIELMVGCHMFIMIEAIYHWDGHVFTLYIYISSLRWSWIKIHLYRYTIRDIPFHIPVHVCSPYDIPGKKNLCHEILPTKKIAGGFI